MTCGTSVTAVIVLALHRGDDGLGRERLQEDQRRAAHEARQQRHGLAVHVRERARWPRARSGRLAHRPVCAMTARGVHDLAVRQDHTLGVGGRAAGEDDLGHVLAADDRSAADPAPGSRRVQARLVHAEDGHAERRRQRRESTSWPASRNVGLGPRTDADGHVGLHAQVERHDGGTELARPRSRRPPARGRSATRSATRSPGSTPARRSVLARCASTRSASCR